MSERQRASEQAPMGGARVLAPERIERTSGTLARAPQSAPWWRASLLLFAAFCLLGLAPIALAANFTGAWRLRLPGAPILYAATAPTSSLAPDLALPRQAWMSASMPVISQPGGGSPLATLEAGFPVTLLKHARVAGGTWSYVQWDGPARGTGGAGWVPDAALVSYGASSHPVGDLGALSPALAQALAPYATQIAVSLYFPDSGQLYRTNDGRPFSLGGGFSAVLLADAFATAESRHQPAPATSTTSAVARVAAADTPSAAGLYSQLGGASGLSGYLSSIGVDGIQPAPSDWASAQATSAALLQFYDALAERDILSVADRDAVIGLLAQANASSTARLLDPRSLSPGSALVVGATQASGSWTLSAAGIVNPLQTHSPRYIVAVAVTGQPSQAAGQQTLSLVFGRLAALLAQG